MHARADAVRHASHEADRDVVRIEAADLDDILAGTEVPYLVDAVALGVVVLLSTSVNAPAGT
jgi:hypothetical protein